MDKTSDIKQVIEKLNQLDEKSQTEILKHFSYDILFYFGMAEVIEIASAAILPTVKDSLMDPNKHHLVDPQWIDLLQDLINLKDTAQETNEE